MKLIKNNIRLGGIRPPPVHGLSMCPFVKGAPLLKQRALFGEQFDPILLF